MNKLSVFGVVLAVVLAVACTSKTEEQKPADQAATTATTTTTTTAATAPAATPAPAELNGTYVFDGDAFLAQLNKSEDPVLKEMPENVRQEALEKFKTFTIEVNGANATAKFGDMSLTGTLSKTGEAADGVRYLMTPTDEKEKQNTVTFIFKDNTLTVDPGKTEADKMVFKKGA